MIKSTVWICIQRRLCNYLPKEPAFNKNIIMSSFKSSGDIQKKEGGPESCFG